MAVAEAEAAEWVAAGWAAATLAAAAVAVTVAVGHSSEWQESQFHWLLPFSQQPAA